MKEGRPSLTAMFVAFARAIGTYDSELSNACRDPAAEHLVPRVWARVLDSAKRSRSATGAFGALRALSLGLVDHLAMRTAIIDGALDEAIAEGTRQLVVLGAGLDGRAHRLESLRDTLVFEVDFPSTQALKRRKAQALPVYAKQVRYAGCDFERVSLEQALLGAGFDQTQPTVWIWEGVTMYLEPTAMLATLDVVTELSAPRSTAIISYITPDITAQGKLLGRIGTRALAAISEPVRGPVSPQVMFERLTSRGFEVVSDVLPIDLGLRFGVNATRHVLVMPDERLVVAKKL